MSDRPPAVRPVLLLAVLLGVLVLTVLWGPASYASSAVAVSSEAGSLKAASCDGPLFASYNLNYGMVGDSLTLDAAIQTVADVLVLEELTPDWRDVLESDRRVSRAWPHRLYLPDGVGAGGLAVLSRYPAVQHAYLPSPVGWFPGWIVHLSTPAGAVQVLALHLKPPYAEVGGVAVGVLTSSGERREELSFYLKNLVASMPTVVLGDLNERSGRAISLLEEAGYQPAVPPGDTWRWPTPLLTLRARLDHIFVSPGMWSSEGEILDLGRSDHLPIRARVCW